MGQDAEFDQFADEYETILERSCAVSGETPDFYAKARVRRCQERLAQALPFETVLDFGCGIGGSFRHFFELLGCRMVIGLDPSAKSLRIAASRHPEYKLHLSTPEDFAPNADLPFVFTNGVFHHIPPADRLDALAYIRDCLSADGIFAFWENNPWNPVVVCTMARNEFDRHARTISPLDAVRMLKAASFRIEDVDFCSFFPRFARRLRIWEPYLTWLPLGAQYLVLARKA